MHTEGANSAMHATAIVRTMNVYSVPVQSSESPTSNIFDTHEERASAQRRCVEISLFERDPYAVNCQYRNYVSGKYTDGKRFFDKVFRSVSIGQRGQLLRV